MPRPKPDTTDVQSSFAGGYNSAGTRQIIDPSQFSAMQNMRLVRMAEMAKTPGLRKVGVSAGGQYMSLFWWNGGSGTGEMLIGSGDGGANNRLETATFDENTGVLTVTSRSTVADFFRCAVQFRHANTDVVYLGAYGNGVKPSRYTGTTYTNAVGASSSGCQSLWVYNQRLFGCAGPSPSPTLYWSAINDGDTIGDVANGGGSATVQTYGAGGIYGGFQVGGSNILVHRNALSVFRGTTFDDINISAGVQGFSPDLGVVLPSGTGRLQPWIVVDQTGYLLTRLGLWRVTENGASRYAGPNQPDPIFELCQTTFEPVVEGLAHNKRSNEIWFLLSTAATSVASLSYYIFIYNTLLQRFTGQRKIDYGTLGGTITGMTSGEATVTGGLDSQLFLVGSYQLTYFPIWGCDFRTKSLEIWKDELTAAGVYTKMTSSVGCRRFFTDSPFTEKAWRWLYVQMGGGAYDDPAFAAGFTSGAHVTYTPAYDGFPVADTSTLQLQANNIVQLSGRGAFLDVTVTDTANAVGSDTGWSVARIEVQGFDYGGRGT